MIAIVDYGLGNSDAIRNMFQRIGATSVVTSDTSVIEGADKLVLPGVGSFDAGMRNLASMKLIDTLNHRVLERKVPILGICLGMQMFSRSSMEGEVSGLGWIAADTVKFSFDDLVHRSPHMGWNTLSLQRSCQVLEGLDAAARFYFAHSYYLRCDNEVNVVATTSYGIGFSSVIEHLNISGTQFHPEKSHRFGMAVLSNFAKAAV